jgi:enoyl-CoA hydratase
MPRHVKIEARGDVALVRIDRPPANALDAELLADGAAALDELREQAPGAVVIVGREGFFSAGVDLKVAPTLDRDGQRKMVDGINRLFAGWYSFERPVVCAVNGHAIAGGLILALCGDHRVCTTAEAKLGLTELRVGIVYPLAAFAVVAAELTPQAVRRVALQADLFGPQRALELGLVDELAEPHQVLDRALEVANELAALPRDAYARVKRQVRARALAELEGIDQDPLLDGWITDETSGASAAVLTRDER